MSSGLSLDEDAIRKLDAFKIPKKGDPKNLAVLFRLNDKMTSIIFDAYIPHDPKYQNSEEEYKAVIESLPKDQCRYVITNIGMKYADGRNTQKLVFISWCPEDYVSSKQKLVFAASKEVLRHRCSDMKEFFGTHIEELLYKDICNNLS